MAKKKTEDAEPAADDKKKKKKTKTKYTAPKAPAKGKKRKSSAAAVLEHLKNNFGAEAAVILGDGYRGDVREATPTGLDAVDNWICGARARDGSLVPGFPCGRMYELYSDEGFGKSSFALMALGAAQRAGATGILVETEHGFTRERAITFGVDVDQLVVAQPQHLEESLMHMEAILDVLDPTLSPAFMVWDSMAGTPTQAEIETGDKPSFDTRAKTMSQALRVLTGKVSRNRCGFMVVNQMREKIGMAFGDPTTTPGGKALKYHSSIRMRLQGQKMFSKDGMPTHKDMDLKVAKSRFTEPQRLLRLRMNFENGFDNDWTNLNLAKSWKLVPPKSRDAGFALARLREADWDPRKAAAIATAEDSKGE